MSDFNHVQRVLKIKGYGKPVSVGHLVTCHVKGNIIDESRRPTFEFINTRSGSPTPITVEAGNKKVIQGWDEGMLGMVEGEVSEIFIPSSFAFGLGGFPSWNIPPNADIILELEIISIR